MKMILLLASVWVAVCLLTVGAIRAANAPLPDTLHVSGYGPYESPLIQPSQSPWFITMDYTPLNDSASVTIVNQDRSFRDYKLVPTTVAGRIVYQGQGTDPVYVENYAGNWTLNLSY